MRPEILVNGRCLQRPITGVERYTSEMVKRLGDRVRVIGPARQADGVRGHAWEQVGLPARVGRNQTLWSPANTGPLAIARQVLTIHDISPLDHPEWFHPAFAAWYGFLLPRLARRVRRIITDSTFSKERIVDRLSVPEERVVPIPCGVDNRFAPAASGEIAAARRRHGLESRYLLTVGSLQPRKNLHTLIEAWTLLRREIRDVELVLVGEGRFNFGRARTDSVPEGVRLLGSVDDDGLTALYSGASAVVVPSRYEGFGLTVLEAMACGAPVVAAAGTALDDAAGAAALRVEAASAQPLAAGLHRILTDEPLRRSLAREGLERARAFTWDRAAESAWCVFLEAADA